MAAMTVFGRLLSPAAVALPGPALTVTLVDYDNRHQIGFATADQSEILSQLPVTVNADGTWTVALLPNAQIRTSGGTASTAWRITEAGGGDADTYWIVVVAGDPAVPVWVGDIVYTLVGGAAYPTPVNLALAGSLSVGGTFTYSGVTIAAPPGDPAKFLAANGQWLTGGGAVSSVNGHVGTVVLGSTDVGALTASQNLADLPSASTARTNLGLGNAAVRAVGTTAGTVATGDDSRIAGAVQTSLATTKGDLFVATGPGTLVRVGVGADGSLLVADATQASGTGWKVVSRDQHASKLGMLLEPFPVEAVSEIAPGLGLVSGNLYGQLARPTSRQPATHVTVWVCSAASGSTGPSYAAVLNEAGDQLGVSADITSYLTNVGNEGKFVELPLLSPTVALDPDTGYYSCILANLSSIPKIAGCLPSAGTFQIPKSRGHLTSWFLPGQSSVPSHVDMSTVTPAVAAYYIAGLPASS